MAQVKDLESSLLDKKDEQEEEEEPEPVKSAFWTKLSLATSMAFWVTLFYVPLVIPAAKQWFFVDMDLPTVLGSPDFISYWPNTVQLIVFTVYFSTGSTVNLAWQGLAGTVGAGLNQFMMGKLFPVGGKCITVAAYTGSGVRGFCEEYADPNYAKYEWFVWFDVIFFMFLLLSSNAKENTVKFGLSWHVSYMMAFMSPTGFQPSHAVNITTVFGVSLAILITLVPSFTKHGIRFNQMVANNIEGHPVAIAKKCREISEGTVKFILAKKPETMEERYHFKVDKVAIVGKIEELEPMAGNMSNDWTTSWWEGWLNLLRGGPHAVTDFRKARTHCGIIATAFQDDIGGFDDVAFVMKKVVSMTDASDYTFMAGEDLQEVKAERASLRAPLEGLNYSSMELLKAITNWKDAQADQNIEVFADRIVGMKKVCDTKFSELYGAYTQWTKTNPVHKKSEGRQLMRTNMSVTVFAVLQMAKEVMDLSDKVVKKYEATVTLSERHLMMTAVKDTWDEFHNTWLSSDDSKPAMLKAMLNAEKRSFVLRNVFSIGLCFALGNFLEGNVFAAPYNPLLAGTLAVLISHFPGSAFYKNLMRLLGLAIGNALPIIMLAFVSIAGRDAAPYLHLLMFFLFELYFGLMYYTSPEWSYVGCIVAGFGCYSFTDPTWSDATFAAGYCKIGQVTAAIAIQIIVDVVDTNIRRKFPPNIVVENMQTMLWGGADEKGEQHDGLVKVFEKFQLHLSSIEPNEELINDIKTSVKLLKGLMASQEQLVSECEAKTTMIAGPSPAFKLDLYKGALSAVKELLGELDALCLVDEFSGKIGELVGDTRGEWFDQQYKNFYKEVLDAMKQTFETLMMIMTKADEGMIPKRQVKVSDVDEDSTHHTDGVRMCVVKRIIGDTLKHVLEIEHLCCESGCLEFDI